MSKSVSAPSLVTNTSPCSNGDIVPGSTLIYGSIFNIPILRPVCFKSVPTLAAVIPFPRELKTPPVTKIYLVMCHSKILYNSAIIV